ncbi:glycine zipper family protein [Paraburkholderia sp. LEh10]|uniref:YMGG-like glycine zipper-containing protein n=1 Tax=Paraburkholderia sp. LEh10 TaxID=2821353 RepID=UPI001AE3950F|nr:YMGG-like glycine zipper-containing protein [Paraburkholderia sp. LEh10]MBP0593016.1 glycine zipper family protein [Paraburkholderia sp. LEh10]
MRRASRNASTLAALLLLAGAATAQQPIFYPAKGQSPQKQASDMSQCESWATQNTGINPAVLAQNAANQAPPPAPSGQRVRGAAGGAAAGAAIGAIAGDAGKGAAAGAIAGTMAGGVRQRHQTAAAQQQQQAMQQQTSQQMATWNRALAACMTGRGYST